MKLKSPHQTSFTSVHIFADKYNEFKKSSVSNGMTLQKLVNRCVYLYSSDEAFRKKIDECSDLQTSGSSF